MPNDRSFLDIAPRSFTIFVRISAFIMSWNWKLLETREKRTLLNLIPVETWFASFRNWLITFCWDYHIYPRTSVRKNLIWNYWIKISRSFIISGIGWTRCLFPSFISEFRTFWNITIPISLMFLYRETVCITPRATWIIIFTGFSNWCSSRLWFAEKSFWKLSWISTVVWIKSIFWIMTNSIWKISVPTLTRDTSYLLRDCSRIWTVRTPTTVTCPCYGQKKCKFHFSFIWKMKNTFKHK